MNFITGPVPLQGALVITPKRFADSRGFFAEIYRLNAFQQLGVRESFIQENVSQSAKGSLRGMHFQCPPHAQAKLVRTLAGSVQDVIVDLRKSSPTYGKTFSVLLDSRQMNMLYVPAGFAHGFLALEDNTIFNYQCSGYYEPAAEDGIRWDDPSLAIEWLLPQSELVVSEKDKNFRPFAHLESPF